MSNSDFSFIVGIVLGAGIAFLSALWAIHDTEIMKAKRECEQTIPRNQKCMYNWTPESTK